NGYDAAVGVDEDDRDYPRHIDDLHDELADPAPIPETRTDVLASMGNYVFDTDALVDAVTADARSDVSGHDMGGDIVPVFVGRGDAAVYDFHDNVIAGTSEHDGDYWRDVGTLETYHAAHMDLVSPWPTYTHSGPYPPAKLVRGLNGEPARTTDSIVSAGAVITGGHVSESVISPRCFVEADAVVTNSVLLDDVYVGRGARVHNAIVDKSVTVPAGMRLGENADVDRAGALVVCDSGLVVAEKGLPL